MAENQTLRSATLEANYAAYTGFLIASMRLNEQRIAHPDDTRHPDVEAASAIYMAKAKVYAATTDACVATKHYADERTLETIRRSIKP
jgi:hypothetical protein